jgi:hypothetical protein
MDQDVDFDWPWWSFETLLKWIGKEKEEEERFAEILKNAERLDFIGERGPLAPRFKKLKPRARIPDIDFASGGFVNLDGFYVYVPSYPDETMPEGWENLRLRAANAKAIWPHGHAAAPETHSGMAGRPSPKHLYLAELERRAKSDEMLGTLDEETNALLHWFKNEHRKLNPGTFKTVRNNIREKYRQLCRESPSSSCMK